jgi:CheY-like chemotaxis protein
LLAGWITEKDDYWMKRVLIVDDAIDLARMMQDAIKVAHPDIPITVVPSAEEALLESTRLSFDLLITDLRLPGMSGLELIRKIRVRQPQIKVILITAVVLDDRLIKQRDEVLPDVFLQKPVPIAAYLNAAEKLLFDGLAPEIASRPEDSPDRGVETRPLEPKAAPARKATGGLARATAAAPTEEIGLSVLLSQMRSTLGALSAMLLDDSGRPVAQAGDLPGEILQGQLIPPLMASLSAGARVSYLLGQGEAHAVQAYRGSDFDLVLSPVGQFTLLVAVKNSPSVLRLALAFEEAMNAQAGLKAALDTMGLHVQSMVEVGAPEELLVEMGVTSKPAENTMPPEILETPLGQDPDLEKFEELFSRKKTGQLRLQDPDDFWSSPGKSDASTNPASGVLTFEQAQKLGLVPPTKED